MRLRATAMLGTGLLVAILLSVGGGGSTVTTATLKNGPNYFTNNQVASPPQYGLRAAHDATAIEYGLL